MNKLKERSEAQEYIREQFQSEDRLAVVIKRPGGVIAQRISTADKISDEKFQKWLRFENAHKGEIYLSVNTLREGARTRLKTDVDQIRHIYLDIDEGGIAAMDKTMMDPRLPTPSVILNTSPDHYQVLWQVKDFGIPQSEALQKSIALSVGSDATVFDAARVLRVPGFMNYKREEPFRVTAQVMSRAVYTPADFHVKIESQAEHRLAVSRPVPNGHSSQSEKDFGYALRHLSSGDSQEKVIEAIREYRVGEKYEGYAERTVKNAAAKLAERGPER